MHRGTVTIELCSIAWWLLLLLLLESLLLRLPQPRSLPAAGPLSPLRLVDA